MDEHLSWILCTQMPHIHWYSIVCWRDIGSRSHSPIPDILAPLYPVRDVCANVLLIRGVRQFPVRVPHLIEPYIPWTSYINGISSYIPGIFNGKSHLIFQECKMICHFRVPYMNVTDYYLNITYRVCCWFLWFVHFRRLLLEGNSEKWTYFIRVFSQALLTRLWSCLLKVCLVWCAESLNEKKWENIHFDFAK